VDWKEFLASVIHSLAWPLAIAFVVYLLRKPLQQRLRELRRVRYRDAEAEFGDYVQDAELAATQAELPSPEPPTGELALSTELWPEISTAPRAAVIEAWLAVERELERLAEQSGVDVTERRWSPEVLSTELEERGVIEPGLAQVIRDLHRARNVAAHVQPYTVERDEVVDYVKLAGRVRSALRLARQSQAAAREGRTAYDLLVYHDVSDPTERTGGAIPSVGDDAESWFGSKIGGDRHVVAVGPGIYEGRVTVALAHSNRPMPELQALIDRQADDS
jgi:hypothetical protein